MRAEMAEVTSRSERPGGCRSLCSGWFVGCARIGGDTLRDDFVGVRVTLQKWRTLLVSTLDLRVFRYAPLYENSFASSPHELRRVLRSAAGRLSSRCGRNFFRGRRWNRRSS